MTVWFQPYQPVAFYSFRQALAEPVVGSRADRSARRRSRSSSADARSRHTSAPGSLELRESQLEAELTRAHARRAAARDPAALPVQHAELDRRADPRSTSNDVGADDAARAERPDAGDARSAGRAAYARSATSWRVVKGYIDLQRARFGDRLDDRVRHRRRLPSGSPVPTLLLQPLVENALRHGLAPQCRVRGGSRSARPAGTAPNCGCGSRDDGVGLPAGFDLSARCRHRPAQHPVAPRTPVRQRRRARGPAERARGHDRGAASRRRARGWRSGMIRFRVLVAEDEPHARSMVVGLLGRDAEVEVVANCADGRAAADAMSRKGIDIAFLDIEMPESSGLRDRRARDGGRTRRRVRHGVQPVCAGGVRRQRGGLRAEAVLRRAILRRPRARQAARARTPAERAGRPDRDGLVGDEARRRRAAVRATSTGWRSRTATGPSC